MNKFAIISSLLLFSLSGCKTIDSVQQDLGSLASSITGEEQATPEQIQAAYEKAQSVFQEALTAYNQIDTENLAQFDEERVAKARKVWAVLEPEFNELRLAPEHALKSASLFSSDTVADEVMSQSQEVISLVTEAQLAKQRITSVLQPIRDEFAILDQLDAETSYEKRYRELDKQHQQLKEMLIDGQEQQVAEYVPKLLEQLIDLEKDAVVQFYFSQYIEKIYGLANSKKVDIFPTVYQDVRKQLEQGETFSKANYREYEQIKQHAALLSLQIDRINSLYAEYLAQKSAIDKDTVEAHMLSLESEIYALTMAAGLGDLRGLSFQEQLQQVRRAIN